MKYLKSSEFRVWAALVFLLASPAWLGVSSAIASDQAESLMAGRQGEEYLLRQGGLHRTTLLPGTGRVEEPADGAFEREQNGDYFGQLRHHFESGEIFKATFEHEFLDTFTGESQRTEGTIWIGKEQYKIVSNTNVMVVDGKISRVYDSMKNRVIISDYIEEEDDFAPSRMLQGVDDSYEVDQAASARGPVIRLTSEDPFAIFTQVTIQLNPQNIPLRIIAIDQVENELITQFHGGEFMRPGEDLFSFSQPDDAEIIDLRDSRQE